MPGAIRIKTSGKEKNRIVPETFDNLLDLGRKGGMNEITKNIAIAFARVYCGNVARLLRERYGSSRSKVTAAKLAVQAGFSIEDEYEPGQIAETYASMRDGSPDSFATFKVSGATVTVGTEIKYEYSLIRGLPTRARTIQKARPIINEYGQLQWLPAGYTIKGWKGGPNFHLMALRMSKPKTTIKAMIKYSLNFYKKYKRSPAVSTLMRQAK